MDDINVVIAGVSSYIDNEFINKIEGWQKWVVGVGSGLMLNNASNIFSQLKENPMIVTLGIINENKINTDLLYKEFKKQAQKGAISTNIPMIGVVTFNEEDVEKVYNNIKMKRGA
jgi:hypothetical protein